MNSVSFCFLLPFHLNLGALKPFYTLTLVPASVLAFEMRVELEATGDFGTDPKVFAVSARVPTGNLPPLGDGIQLFELGNRNLPF